MKKLNIGNLNLVNVMTDKLPKEIKLNSLKIESSYIKNNNKLRFLNKVDVKEMSVENSVIDSISDLGLFGSDNVNIKSLREKSNYNNLEGYADMGNLISFIFKCYFLFLLHTLLYSLDLREIRSTMSMMMMMMIIAKLAMSASFLTKQDSSTPQTK